MAIRPRASISPSPTAPEGPDDLLSTEQVAAWLQVPVRTLYFWRQVNAGPPAIRIGRVLRWRRSDVTRWLADHQDAR